MSKEASETFEEFHLLKSYILGNKMPDSASEIFVEEYPEHGDCMIISDKKNDR